MDGNRIVGADRLLIPDFLVNLINGEYFSCIPDEKQQDIVFDGSQFNQFSIHRNFLVFIVDQETSAFKDMSARLGIHIAKLRIAAKLGFHHGPLCGMAVRRGITLIVGGGYHGKSTLLKALEAGVYNHIAGDGREYVITDSTAVKLRAEDGRSISNVDISLFINDLPNGRDTSRFSSADASGSTSQAAAVIEGIEAGAAAFLIDEDTSATNFMLRDELMQKIVSRDKEPITPFIERARDLYEKAGISTVLVAGSSGAYFYIADTVIQMDSYRPLDITEQVKKACEAYREISSPALTAPGFSLPKPGRKLPAPAASSDSGRGGANSGGRRGNRKQDDRIKVKIFGRDSFQVGKEPVDLRFVEQLADSEQTAALAQMVRFCLERGLFSRCTLKETVDILMLEYEKKGLAAFNGSNYTAMGLCMPRVQEIYACLNRFRG